MRVLSLELIKDFEMLLVPFFIALNVLSFFLIKLDKKRAVHHQWRVPVRIFFALAFCGGAAGVYLGMIIFRHKTKQLLFTMGIPALMALNIIFYYYVFR